MLLLEDISKFPKPILNINSKRVVQCISYELSVKGCDVLSLFALEVFTNRLPRFLSPSRFLVLFPNTHKHLSLVHISH